MQSIIALIELNERDSLIFFGWIIHILRLFVSCHSFTFAKLFIHLSGTFIFMFAYLLNYFINGLLTDQSA